MAARASRSKLMRTHSVSDYITAAIDAGLEIEAFSEALVDVELLHESGVSEDPLDPERAILGLPFALVWTFRRQQSSER
jgi:hypothetical protein